MSTIAINDIKPNNLVFLTTEEAAFIDGGDGWWDIPSQIGDGVRGSISTGAGYFTGSYVGSGGDLFRSTVIGASGLVAGYKNPVPVTEPWKAAGNFTSGFATGLVAGYGSDHDHF